MRIGIGNDHVAVEMKNEIKAYLEEKGYADKDYIDAKLEVMKQEIIREIEASLDILVEPIVDRLLDEKIGGVDNEDIEGLFED